MVQYVFAKRFTTIKLHVVGYTQRKHKAAAPLSFVHRCATPGEVIIL